MRTLSSTTLSCIISTYPTTTSARCGPTASPAAPGAALAATEAAVVGLGAALGAAVAGAAGTPRAALAAALGAVGAAVGTAPAVVRATLAAAQADPGDALARRRKGSPVEAARCGTSSDATNPATSQSQRHIPFGRKLEADRCGL